MASVVDDDDHEGVGDEGEAVDDGFGGASVEETVRSVTTGDSITAHKERPRRQEE